jgi:CubicO group peptidase (beta-lactamase class C family)
MRWPTRLLPRRVIVHEPSEVTSFGAEVDPREVGLVRGDVEAIWAAVSRYYGIGLHPALALCLRRGGKVVIDRAIGHASGNAPGERGLQVRATPSTRFNLFSGSKSVTAMLIHLLADEGVLRTDHPVAHYLPEFGRRGKDRITIDHLLTHRAGIPSIPADRVDLDLLTDGEAVLEILCDAEPEAEAGSQLAYHAVSGGFVLGELVRRVTGEDLRALFRRRVTEPLGLDTLGYGVPPDRLDSVAREAFTGPTPRQPFKGLLERSLGLGMEALVDIANDPRFLTGVVPSGNVIGTPSEVGLFFELLLRRGSLGGVRVFDEGTVHRAIAADAHRELDRIIMLPIRYGSGFMLGGDYLSFYGPHTPAAFGHLGFTNVLAWADPERDISVAFMNNGKPFVTPELVLWLDIMRVIAARIPRSGPTDGGVG